MDPPLAARDRALSAAFRLLDPGAAQLDYTVDGVAARAPAGTSVAAALLLAGCRVIRRAPADGAPRAPYCMMGACHECLAAIDGVPDCQTCLIPLRDGMQISLEGDPAA